MSALAEDACEHGATVLIVEDHAILAQSLSLTLRLEGMEPVVAPALDADSVLDHARALCPDVVVLDLNLGAGQTSLSMIGPLVDHGRRVLVLTGTTDEGLQGAALDAGAVAVFHKSDDLEGLCQGIRDVTVDRVVMRPSRRDELVEKGRERRAAERRIESLSRREREVLAGLVDGSSAEAIAAEQFVSIGTVRTHIRAVLRKLGVNSQLAAVAVARRVGWPPA